MTTITPERPEDAAGIRAVLTAAFPTDAEARLVDALRASDAWLPELSLIALRDERIVGHLLLSRAELDSGHAVLALAPMAVVPPLQGQDIGGALVRAGLERAAATDFPLVVVLGHADYYPRFGFGSARALGVDAPFDVPDEAWMALPLPAHTGAERGTVVYPPPFAEV